MQSGLDCVRFSAHRPPVTRACRCCAHGVSIARFCKRSSESSVFDTSAWQGKRAAGGGAHHAKGEATPATSLRYQRQHAGDQAGAAEEEDEGLRELRREIERAGGKPQQVSTQAQ